MTISDLLLLALAVAAFALAAWLMPADSRWPDFRAVAEWIGKRGHK